MENERFETFLKWSLNPDRQVSLEKVRDILERSSETEVRQSKREGENGERRGSRDREGKREHEISVGEPLNLSWEDLRDSAEPDVGQIISHEEGGPNDRWMEKEVVVFEASLSTDYKYVSYDKAMGDVIFANLFREPLESSDNARYNVREFDGDTIYRLNTTFRYQKGSVFLSESLRIGKAEENSVSEDAFRSSIITSEPLKNTRTYVSKEGIEFTLADLSNNETYAIVSVDQHVITLDFWNLTEEEIHQVLDMVIL